MWNEIEQSTRESTERSGKQMIISFPAPAALALSH